MRGQKTALEQIASAVDLQAEPFPGMPLVELLGDRRVLIENHQGVTEYGCNQICVKVKFGQICVCGSSLKLARMTKQQMVVLGNIDSVSVIRGKKT